MPTSAEERHAEIQALLAQGLSKKHVAQRLGLSVRTVRNRLADPDGSKAKERKRSYSGVCADCGGPTNGSNGFEKAPKRCVYCTTSKPRPKRQPDARRKVPVRLTDIDFQRRIDAAHEACRIEHDERERQMILWSAIDPSDTVYWVAA